MYVLIYNSIYFFYLWKNSQEIYVRITNPLFLRDLPNVQTLWDTQKHAFNLIRDAVHTKIDTFAQDHL